MGKGCHSVDSRNKERQRCREQPKQLRRREFNNRAPWIAIRGNEGEKKKHGREVESLPGGEREESENETAKPKKLYSRSWRGGKKVRERKGLADKALLWK